MTLIGGSTTKYTGSVVDVVVLVIAVVISAVSTGISLFVVIVWK